jgi:hypothetical protein
VLFACSRRRQINPDAPRRFRPRLAPSKEKARKRLPAVASKRPTASLEQRLPGQ